MDEFINNIKDTFFKYINVDIYADNDRLVIELKKRSILTYYPNKGELNIHDPLLIETGLEIKKLFDMQVGDLHGN